MVTLLKLNCCELAVYISPFRRLYDMNEYVNCSHFAEAFIQKGLDQDAYR